MDASVLPEICALAISIFLFHPIVSRVGRHADTWLAGWILLLAHYIAHSCMSSPGRIGMVASVGSMATLEIALICFLRASANVGKRRIGWRLTLLLASPMLLQGTLAALHVHAPLVQRVAALLFLAPAAYILATRCRLRSIVGLAAAFAMVGVFALIAPYSDPRIISNLLLMSFFFAIAATYLQLVPHISRSSTVAVVGLVAWGLCSPVEAILWTLRPGIVLNHGLVMIPQFVFIAGIVFSFIEEVVTQADHLAQHDPLTGLPNARLFEQRATAAMTQASATGTPLAFLVIDVDEFKKVNDTLGHQAGDELLRALAVRLSWHIGSGDMLARTGGDEFTAILAGVGDEHHLRFIARAMMSAASVPFVITGRQVDCRISVGIAVAPQVAQDIVALREAADRAMYQAKRRGGSLMAFAGEEHDIVNAG